LPLYGAALDAAHVTAGTRLPSPGLLAIVRARLPGIDVRESDLEALPFADASFDAVTAVNSLFCAADMAGAMRELSRIVRLGGRVVLTAWGPPERREALSAALSAVGPLLPPPAAWPLHLGSGNLIRARRISVRVVEEGEVACPFIFPSTEASWRANARAGPTQLAIAQRRGYGPRRLRGGRSRSHAPRREYPLRECLPLGGGRTTVATI
jgi:SAM-dependent methyltransferase